MRFFRLCAIGLLASVLAVAQRPAGNTEGFDYYLLSLSWAPEFCYTHPANPECGSGQHHGFIVHGLWPELRNGRGPEYCSHTPGLADPTKMLDLMPDRHLIEHEWQAHGTCSGLSADAYFENIRRAFESFRIPKEFTAPRAKLALTSLDMKRAFESANPVLNDSELIVECPGAYLKAVEICLSKGLHPVPCPAVRHCTVRMLHVVPVR
jgi:ribonuclease T2